MIKVGDVLQTKGKKVWSIHPEATAYKALEIMADKDIGALLVIEKGHVVGIFSERDYARKVILKGKSSRETSVGELMTREIYSITQDKSVEECMALMTAIRCRHIPVYENHKLVGIVSISDIVNAIMIEQKIKIHDLENYIAGGEFVEVEDNP